MNKWWLNARIWIFFTRFNWNARFFNNNHNVFASQFLSVNLNIEFLHVWSFRPDSQYCYLLNAPMPSLRSKCVRYTLHAKKNIEWTVNTMGTVLRKREMNGGLLEKTSHQLSNLNTITLTASKICIRMINWRTIRDENMLMFIQFCWCVKCEDGKRATTRRKQEFDSDDKMYNVKSIEYIKILCTVKCIYYLLECIMCAPFTCFHQHPKR